MVSETHANGSRGRTQHTMALDQFALQLGAAPTLQMGDWYIASSGVMLTM